MARNKYTRENPPQGGWNVSCKWSSEIQAYICHKIFWCDEKGRRHYLVSMPLEKENRDLRVGDIMPDEFQTVY